MPRAWKPNYHFSFFWQRRVWFSCSGCWPWPWWLWSFRSSRRIVLRFILIWWCAKKGGNKFHWRWRSDWDPGWVFWWFWWRWRFGGHNFLTPWCAWCLIQVQEILEHWKIMFSLPCLLLCPTSIMGRTEWWHIGGEWCFILWWWIRGDVDYFRNGFHLNCDLIWWIGVFGSN